MHEVSKFSQLIYYNLDHAIIELMTTTRENLAFLLESLMQNNNYHCFGTKLVVRIWIVHLHMQVSLQPVAIYHVIVVKIGYAYSTLLT